MLTPPVTPPVVRTEAVATAPVPFAMGRVEFIGMMAMVQALQALSIDVMLPALGVISRELAIPDANSRQLIVSLYLLCSGLGALFPGALADRFGRRRVLLTGLVAYAVLACVCAAAPSFQLLLAARALQGLLTAPLLVVPMTIVRDRFSGDRMASLQSMVAVVFMAVPMVAPMLGQTIMLFAGWRWIFGATALAACAVTAWVALRLPETLRPEYRQEIHMSAILGNVRLALGTREAIGYILGAALINGTLFAYVSSAQQLIAEHFGAGLRFPMIFATMALIMAMANFANSRIVHAFGARRVSQMAVLLFTLVNAVHFVFVIRGEDLWLFVTFMGMAIALVSFINANFQSIALQPFAHMAGSAASVISFLRSANGGLLGVLVGQAYDGTARPLIGFMIFSGAGAFVCALYADHWRPFRRLHYPD
ncbi:multidrug effflux MFS transporter [Novosphingobium colocasiae]|uniref:multidrug effflux MFS transporter n=1 Tax=Novosphingobium colocasiae TaxID=1256513 RepID=UPI0035B418DA